MTEIKHLVRLMDADIKGTKGVLYGLREIRGVSHMFAHAICKVAKLDVRKQMGTLSQDELNSITKVLDDPSAAGIPTWMLNHRRERETGANKHYFSTKLKVTIDNDIKELKKMKCYRGVRHILELPVRGQRTRSHFRRNKGKVHLGVRVADKSRGRV